MKRIFFALLLIGAGVLIGVLVRHVSTPLQKDAPVDNSSEISEKNRKKSEPMLQTDASSPTSTSSNPLPSKPRSEPTPPVPDQPSMNSPGADSIASNPIPSTQALTPQEHALALSQHPTIWTSGDITIIADFNQPSPNNLGGEFGTFNFNPTDKIHVCRAELDQKERIGEIGSSLRLTYDVNQTGAFNGFWMKMGPADAPFDASVFQNLVLWIKGDANEGIPSQLKIELKNGVFIAPVYVMNIKAVWSLIRIPLGEFTGRGLDLQHVTEFTIVFENRYVQPASQGSILIDNIGFEK